MFLALVLTVALFAEAVVSSPYYDNIPVPQIIRQEYNTDNLPNSYQFNYDASDGSSRTEHGEILNPGTNDAALAVKGAVRWYNSKGELFEMIYKAGKRGYNTIIRKVES